MSWIMDLKPASEYANHSTWDTDVKYEETDSRKHRVCVCVCMCAQGQLLSHLPCDPASTPLILSFRVGFAALTCSWQMHHISSSPQNLPWEWLLLTWSHVDSFFQNSRIQNSHLKNSEFSWYFLFEPHSLNISWNYRGFLFFFFLISARIDSTTMDILSFSKGTLFLFLFFKVASANKTSAHPQWDLSFCFLIFSRKAAWKVANRSGFLELEPP